MTVYSSRLRGSSAYILYEAEGALQSQQKASEWGGYLAVITDRQENDFLTHVFSGPSQAIADSYSNSPDFEAWDFNPLIGYTKRNTWDWSWADGSSDRYTNWHPSISKFTAANGESAALYLTNNDTKLGTWLHGVRGKTAIAELQLQPVFSFDQAPNEGKLFTTSVQLASNSEVISALEGTDIYWTLDGLNNNDIESGALSGSARLINGSISVAHKLKADSDLDETFRLNLFSDQERSHLIGSEQSKLAPALLSSSIRGNQLTLVFSEEISISGSGILNPALLSVLADGQQRATGRTANENISRTSEGYELTIPLAGWGIDKTKQISVSYSLNGLQGNDGFIVDGAGRPIDNLLNIFYVDNNMTFNSSASISKRGLADAYKNLVLEGNLPIAGYGNLFDNKITGNSANNTIDGLVGADTMIGGLGDDSYMVDNLGDAVIELADQGIDSIDSTVTYSLGNNVENLQLLGSSLVNGYGNGLSNVLTGNVGSNILDGGLGSDTLIGGKGNDIYYVDSIADVIVEDGGRSDIDTVYSQTSWTLGANLENLILSGSFASSGIGNSLANKITGNAANNVIDGGASGKDTLTGGLGADNFSFSTRPLRFSLSEADIITDFKASQGDVISLSRSAFNFSHSNPRVTIVANSASYNSSLKSNADLIYNSSNGELTWNQNGILAGVGSGGVFAVLQSPSGLTANSFTFI